MYVRGFLYIITIPLKGGITIKLFKLDLMPLNSKLSDNEKILIIYLGNLYTDINILLKTCLCSRSTELKDDIAKVAQFSQSMFFFETLAGKLNEGWEIFSKKYSTMLSDEANSTLAYLKNYFNNENNILRNIRHRFAFHYDENLSNELLEKYNDANPGELKIYLSKTNGNCYFHFAESIMTRALIEDDIDRTIIILDEIVEVSGKLLHLVFSIFNAIIKQHGVTQDDLEEVEIDDIGSAFKTRLPYFLSHEPPSE